MFSRHLVHLSLSKNIQTATPVTEQGQSTGQALLQYCPYCWIVTRHPGTNAKPLENSRKIFYLLMQTRP